MPRSFSFVTAVTFLAIACAAQEGDERRWGDFVESDFPFFSSVLDCRELGGDFPKDNLTPRGLILNLGSNVWACYDLDLLRIACVWQGEEGQPPVTPEALAPGSYHVAGQKTRDGQEHLPKPVGRVWLTNGIYPGWQVGETPVFDDPREPAPSADEVGRGALERPGFSGIRFQPSELSGGGGTRVWYLSFKIDGMDIEETWGLGLSLEAGQAAKPLLNRVATVPARSEPLICMVGVGDLLPVQAQWHEVTGATENLRVRSQNGERWVSLQPSEREGRLSIQFELPAGWEHTDLAATRAAIWPEKVRIPVQLAQAKPTDTYVVDKIPLPVPNPWKRNVRLADIDFLDDQGNAAAVTFDGDVWLISGLKGDLENVTWRRFASGLHEPMSLVVGKNSKIEARNAKEAEIFVFDRNGIWKLLDTNGDGECDRYEMFCNLFAQTAETREFPNSMKLGPDGSLFIAKGGQEGATRGKHNGTVIRVAPDGKSFEVVAHGLRQPFIGVHPLTGLVTASDQQGQWVPSTPLHVISGNQFYGHMPGSAKGEPYPEKVAEPLSWIPHPVNPSSVTQVWALDPRFGPAAGSMIHVGYNRPELFRVVFHPPEAVSPDNPPRIAAVTSFTRDLDFGPLNAKVNPADGQLYVAGFQVWGTVAQELSGLARVRHTGAPRVLLEQLIPTDKGVVLRFNAALDPAVAADPANYSAERWNYKRTEKYGSPHLKLDGSTGQEWAHPSAAYLSIDKRSVLVAIPDMRAGIHQMRVGWGVRSEDGLPAQNTAYFSPWELDVFDGKALGFGEIEVDLTPRVVVQAGATQPATAEEGEKLAQMFGCMACHSIDGSTLGKVGPSWKGLFGSARDIAGSKQPVTADEEYLRESILNPTAKIVKGFEKFDSGMPIYDGILNDQQIRSLILFMETLK
jgi:cytochrome c2/glucose/arabinose dehydrogenase